jgi:hypothetical protein
MDDPDFRDRRQRDDDPKHNAGPERSVDRCKPQGEMRTKMPTMSATHSSHAANWTTAATAITKMTMPPTHRVFAPVSSPEKPSA